MKYKINKIIIQNFKVFGLDSKTNKFYEKRFSQNLQILTGQNGYGKSSIFDAIELTLTGTISRLYSVSGRVGRQSFKDNLIANNKNIDLIVGIELYDNHEDKYISILKHIPKNKIKFEKEDKLEEWFDTYIKEDKFLLENILHKDYKISNSKKIIKNLLEIEPEYFYINYIQQQDPINFLKNKEESRKDVIDKLLQIDNLKGDRYNAILEKVEEYARQYNELKYTVIQKKKKLKDHMSNQLPERPLYNKLFKNRNDIEWDLEIEKIDSEYYTEDINNIKLLVSNLEVYKDYKLREKLKKICEDKNIIERLSYYIKYRQEIDSITNNKTTYDDMFNIKHIISNNKWNLLYSGRYKKYFDINKIKNIEHELHSIQNLKNNSNTAILEIDKNRTNLKKLLTNNEYQYKLSENKCILCGQDYPSQTELMNSIDNYTKLIEEFFGTVEKDIKYRSEKIKLEIKSEEDSIDETIKLISCEEVVDNEKYKKILTYTDDTMFNSICKELKSLNIDLIKLTSKINKLSLPEIEVKILEEIRKNINNTNTINLDVILRIKKLDEVYIKYFNQDEENVKLITVDEVDKKLEYLNYCYNYYLLESNNNIIKEIDGIKMNMIKLRFKLEKFKELKSEYDKIINDYVKSVISKIEIPLYIYSGKILQSIPTGLGVFCNIGAESADKITRLKFLGNMKSSHDIVNTFSTGQLAGFIISFTLAMKKVYNNNLDVILIDDPVQTMDELNLISFTEILRNEFSDKQVIMSTHESNIAGYINYKYSKYNLDSSIMDVMNEFN